MTTARVGIDITGRDTSGPAFQSAIGNLKKLTSASDNFAGRQRNMMFQMNDVMTSLAGGMNPLMVMAQQGPQIAQIYGMGNGGVAGAFKDVGNMMMVAAKRVGPLAMVGGILATGLTYEVNKASGEVYTMGETFAAAFGVIQDGIMGNVKPAFEAIKPMAKDAVDYANGSFKLMANTIIGYNMSWWEVMKRIGGAIPDLFKLAGQAMVNSIGGAIEFMINNAIKGLNKLGDIVNKANSWLPKSLQGEGVSEIKPFSLPKFGTDETWKGITDSFKGLSADIVEALNFDYVGKGLKMIGARAAEDRAQLLLASQKPPPVLGMAGRVGKSTGGGFASLNNGELKTIASEFGVVNDEVTALSTALDGVGRMFDSWIDKAIDGSLKFKDVLSSVNDFAKSMLSQTLKGLATNLLQGPEHPLYGGRSGGILGSLFGGLMGGMPSFAVGTPYVQKDMVAKIHKGEAIIPASVMEGARRGGSGGKQNVIIHNYAGNVARPSVQEDSNGNLILVIQEIAKRTVDSRVPSILSKGYGIKSPNIARGV